MPFKPGHSKIGGRQPGTPNVLTREIRAILKDVVQNELTTLPERLATMTDDQRMTLLVKLLPYVLPTIERTHHTTDEPPTFGFD